MAQYKADVWLGSKSGRQTVSVSASSLPGAVEQICTIYHVNDTDIWNVREVPRQRSGHGECTGGDNSDDASLWGGVALVGLLLVVWVVATFTPVIFGVGASGAAWWLLCRLQGLSTDALLGPGQRRALLRSLAVTILIGSLGFVAGAHIQQVVWGDVLPAAEKSRQAVPEERSEPTGHSLAPGQPEQTEKAGQPGQPMQTVRSDGTQQSVPPLQKQGAP